MDRDFSARAARVENIVMIVDDDAFIHEVFKKMLGDMALLVHVNDATQMMAQYSIYKPDAVFLDVHMPGRDGFDLLSDLKYVDNDAYVVMASGDHSPFSVTRARQKGAIAYITKPFEQITLLRILGRCRTFLFSDHMVPKTAPEATHMGGSA